MIGAFCQALIFLSPVATFRIYKQLGMSQCNSWSVQSWPKIKSGDVASRETIRFVTLRQLMISKIERSWRHVHPWRHRHMQFLDGSTNKRMRGPSQLSTPLRS